MSKYATEPIGTPKAHYAPPSSGPFKCGNCVHFYTATKTCDHPDVKEDADSGKIAKDKEGRPLVESNGCCNYFR